MQSDKLWAVTVEEASRLLLGKQIGRRWLLRPEAGGTNKLHRTPGYRS